MALGFKIAFLKKLHLRCILPFFLSQSSGCEVLCEILKWCPSWGLTRPSLASAEELPHVPSCQALGRPRRRVFLSSLEDFPQMHTRGLQLIKMEGKIFSTRSEALSYWPVPETTLHSKAESWPKLSPYMAKVFHCSEHGYMQMILIFLGPQRSREGAFRLQVPA